MGFLGFGRKRPAQVGGFGRKGLGAPPSDQPSKGRIFGARRTARDSTPFDAYFSEAERHARGSSYPASGCYKALEYLTPEERGDLLADLAERPGIYDGYQKGKSPQEMIAHYTLQSIWRTEIAVRDNHLGALLTLLIGNKSYRDRPYFEREVATLLKLIGSSITQGAYLSSGDCEALAAMATEIRSRHLSSKADIKKMIKRAEKLEKLAGVKVSATEFLMQRCEGADNPYGAADISRPNAQFWADLFAETTMALEEIRLATKGAASPKWARSEAAFNAEWPPCGDVLPSFDAWKAGDRPVKPLVEHNGKRNGWAEAAAYRDLPDAIPLAVAHSRFCWNSDQIPRLDVLADLENPDWTALVEHLITQRRATKATKTWRKEALALCKPLGLETVEARLHDWLTLFHTPALDRQVYSTLCNGERFAFAVDRLEAARPQWADRHAHDIPALGRAIAIVAATGGTNDVPFDFHPGLVRLDDRRYKNNSATDGVLGLRRPDYKNTDTRTRYESLSSWMRLSVENEEFLRGVVWLAALMPDRARAILALEHVAQTAATNVDIGDDYMRSKIIANAAVATLIDMGGDDIQPAVLRLSKAIQHQTVRAPLLACLTK